MTTLHDWTRAACAELGVQADDDTVRAILDLARDVAHQVERPAAPVTAFLAGLAVSTGQPLAAVAGRLRDLASSMAADEAGGPAKPAP
jgi:Domain of unknown function (DUF6457)